MKQYVRPQVPVLILSVLTAVLGFFLRMNQLRTEMGSDGSVLWGGTFSIALAVVCVIFVVALICLLLPMNQQPNDGTVFSAKLLPNALLLLAAAALLIHSIMNWNSGAESSVALSRALAKLMPLLGIVAAVCLATAAICSLRGTQLSPLLYMCLSIYLALHLINRFQHWNSDPAVQDYCYTLFGVVCAMLGMFQLGGFSFGKGKRRMTLFWLLCTVLFGAVTLADAIGQPEELLFSAALVLIAAVNAVCLLTVKEPEPET